MIIFLVLYKFENIWKFQYYIFLLQESIKLVDYKKEIKYEKGQFYRKVEI